jgi:RNA polymerase subunit RPABC4/transcription elongation factor Spt4
MVSRFCTRCGQMLPAGASTCPRCNAPVVSPAPPVYTSRLAATPSASAGPPPTASSAGAGPSVGGARGPTDAGSDATLPARRVCPNCRASMRWIGHYSLHASGPPTAGGAPPGSGVEVTETLLPFSLYYCAACGKFDFYYPGT